MTVFDIGANLGIYTLLAAGPVGASGTVHAFEPVPDLLSYLEESVRRSGAGNVVVNPLAVGDCSEPVPMYLALKKKHSGWHSLAPSADRPRQIQVQGITLDDYVEARGLDRVDLIKIDIEGGELPAFRGASRLLSRPDAPILQAELCDSHCAHFGYTSRDAKEYLAALGYAGYRAGGDGKWRTVSPDESHRKAENVFFLKPGQLSRAPEEWGLPQPAGDL
jgi:FkbM family methyltransferase